MGRLGVGTHPLAPIPHEEALTHSVKPELTFHPLLGAERAPYNKGVERR